MLGVQGAAAELIHSVPIQQVAQILVIPNLDLLDLVRGAETVEEWRKGTRPLIAERWATAPRSMTS